MTFRDRMNDCDFQPVKRKAKSFTEFLNDDGRRDPIYEKEGIPRCPPGYIFDREKRDCVPKTNKDKVKGRLQHNSSGGSHSGAGYGVWGSHGQDGSYAFEDGSNLGMPNTHKHDDNAPYAGK
jgi:hypothetical protein